ncbi:MULTISPECIES: PLD nuclease N-terminal domain-containing protein [unclassified Arthrobacter]|uniref:PLD nuclease N-terminal domain-containing protein n=1 Tax=unclassified Arthrobacter TaxID=235627 RepID=UPI001492C8BA|nr:MULTISPECIES: PLD nuclease N-terminal domain-containing protein [unclassified Arthrobacter]MBE0010400.1 PLDc_N domain-containing protein [Arthrobacter sp. AET 35A]NOJ59136.1 PLDc_N domain-containing protein [Arthrobacter sp. 260]NOJ64277.1 PLDc_N domain-containing protein [Arthrobacter sp. 147(2020)]
MSINFWDFFWATLVFFLLVSYLSLLFFVLADIIRNREMGRWVKFVWILLLVFLPFLTALAYLIAHGQAMTLRAEALNEMSRAQVAGSVSNEEATAVNQLKTAKTLLDERAITQTEFQRLKESILQNLPFSSGRSSESGPLPQ